MNHWLYTPNAIVRSQHGWRYIYPSAGWPVGQTRYFWKTFEVAPRAPSVTPATESDAQDDLFRARWDRAPLPGKRPDPTPRSTFITNQVIGGQ
jgi:hypothetical protein